MTERTHSRFFSRSSWPLPVTVLVAWAVGAVVLPVVRRLTTLVGDRLAFADPSYAMIYMLLVVVVPVVAAAASALTLPRQRAGRLGLTLLCAMPVPIVFFVNVVARMSPEFPRYEQVALQLMATGVLGSCAGALLVWLVRRGAAGR
ncbi:hypothetical protein [Actinomyces wuliandei]|uniref:hypothetical protein n=1 Tax=Actinomyces wuliandei TaxID=2057743 RepID=UPI000FDBC709|nr:hypothetical protein [Actinomyces wuliandei]